MKIKRNCMIPITLALICICGMATIYVINNVKGVTKIEIPTSESVVGSYQGMSTMELMPHDLTFTKSDVPDLINHLNASNYKAVYLDDEMYLRVTSDNLVHISTDSAATWQEYDTQNISSEDFAKWLLENDPLPGYSMKEMQNRLKQGAEVKHMIFENGKEIYIVIDEKGAQLELVQPQKLAAILLDGQRMMITSEQLPMQISKHKLEVFHNLLVTNDILTNTLAEKECLKRIKHIKKNDAIFTLTE